MSDNLTTIMSGVLVLLVAASLSFISTEVWKQGERLSSLEAKFEIHRETQVQLLADISKRLERCEIHR